LSIMRVLETIQGPQVKISHICFVYLLSLSWTVELSGSNAADGTVL